MLKNEAIIRLTDSIGLVASIIGIAGFVAAVFAYLLRRYRNPKIAIGGSAAVLAVLVAGAFALASVSSGPTVITKPTETVGAATPTVAPTATPVPIFSTASVYSYNYPLGQAKAHAPYTNDNVFVTLSTLSFEPSRDRSIVTVDFHNADPKLNAHFAFYSLANVFLIDDFGLRYSAISATPPELLISPSGNASITVEFPLIHSNVMQLMVYFNTDYQALQTACTVLLPNGAAHRC